MACGLAELGHQVTLYAAPGSRAPEPNGQLHVVPGGYGQMNLDGEWRVWEWYAHELLASDLIISGSHSHYETEQIYYWHREQRGKILNVLNGLVTHTPRPQFNIVLGSEKWKQLSLEGHSQFYQTPWEKQMGPYLEPMRPEALAGVIPWATNTDFYCPADGTGMLNIDVKHQGSASMPGMHEPKSALNDAGYLLYVGRPTPYKGLGLALEVAERTAIPLKVVMGVGQAEHAMYAGQFSAEISRLKAKGVPVEWVRLPENSQHHVLKRELYRHAKALLFPVTSHEPFGLVPIEAMACGCPVVASNLGAMPEIVLDGITGCLCPVLEYSALDQRWLAKADALVDAVQNRLPGISRDDVRLHAKERFNRLTCADRYIQLARALK